MARDSLHYDKMVENALRGVVRQALASVVDQGLPGNHHFYLTFRTQHPDVEIAERLHSQYPREMTIVLQHQFWGLEANDDHFVVNLSFSNIPERLKIPYAALVSFVDPSVKFGLQFTVPEDAGGKAAAPAAPKESPTLALATVGGQPERPKDEAKTQDAPAKEDAAAKPASDGGAEDQEGDKKAPEKVVSLDAFRKK